MTRHPGLRPRRLVAACTAVVVGTAGVLVATAGPAAADSAQPGDFRSEVTAIEPPVDGVTARVVGTDSFLELEVDDGRTVIVEGYQGEPYLRFLPDGTVEQNQRSEATYLNEDRYAAVDLPPEIAELDPTEVEPAWEAVASDGAYAWHDHRIHWMSTASPPVARGERVTGVYDPWRVPITVDGASAEVQGTLRYATQGVPVGWLALALAAAAAVVLGGRRRSLRIASAVLLATSVLALVTGRAEFVVSPPGTGANPLLWVLPAVAVAAAGVAVALGRRSPAVVAALASVAALSGWGLLRLPVLLRPVLPTGLPNALDRASVGLALGVAAGAAWSAIAASAPRPTSPRPTPRE